MISGGTPRKLGVEGEQLAGVHTLRTPEDSATIYSEANGKKVVIVGGSFIGMEVSYIYALCYHSCRNENILRCGCWLKTSSICLFLTVIKHLT